MDVGARVWGCARTHTLLSAFPRVAWSVVCEGVSVCEGVCVCVCVRLYTYVYYMRKRIHACYRCGHVSFSS
jgi:hypothetical protein